MNRLAVAIVPALACFLSVAARADDAPHAVSCIVSGNVQMVGFRAMILRQAIAFNLAGHAKNREDRTVEFVLQGDAKRITDALTIIEMGTDKSSGVKVAKSKAKPESGLTTFTVVAWTSTTRMITTPYDLVFTLRKKDDTVSEKEATKTYHQILLDTLQGGDREKITDHGD